jgi:Tol biopolymer transport system component
MPAARATGPAALGSGPCREPLQTAESASGQQEATWSPDGTTIVYSERGQLWHWTPNQPSVPPHLLTEAGSDDHDPSFAPQTKPRVLAFIDESRGGGRLCFATVGPYALVPDCKPQPQGFRLTHQLSWSPDGRELIATGVRPCGFPRPDRLQSLGLFRFTTNEPSTAHASAWDDGELVTDISRCGIGVNAGAFSPDGKQVALLSNLSVSSPSFHLFLVSTTDFNRAPGQDVFTHARSLGVPACQVSWRPDSQALVVMQADSTCQQPAGNIWTSDLDGHLHGPLATYAADPEWQPLPIGG